MTKSTDEALFDVRRAVRELCDARERQGRSPEDAASESAWYASTCAEVWRKESERTVERGLKR